MRSAPMRFKKKSRAQRSRPDDVHSNKGRRAPLALTHRKMRGRTTTGNTAQRS